MRLAYSTLACPRWTVEEAVAAGVRCGYDAIEWRLADGAIIEPETALLQAAPLLRSFWHVD
jgi:hypothetical protein